MSPAGTIERTTDAPLGYDIVDNTAHPQDHVSERYDTHEDRTRRVGQTRTIRASENATSAQDIVTRPVKTATVAGATFTPAGGAPVGKTTTSGTPNYTSFKATRLTNPKGTTLGVKPTYPKIFTPAAPTKPKSTFKTAKPSKPARATVPSVSVIRVVGVKRTTSRQKTTSRQETTSRQKTPQPKVSSKGKRLGTTPHDLDYDTVVVKPGFRRPLYLNGSRHGGTVPWSSSSEYGPSFSRVNIPLVENDKGTNGGI